MLTTASDDKLIVVTIVFKSDWPEIKNLDQMDNWVSLASTRWYLGHNVKHIPEAPLKCAQVKMDQICGHTIQHECIQENERPAILADLNVLCQLPCHSHEQAYIALALMF